MKTLLIDDEPLALDILEAHAAKIPDLEVVGRCQNALDANAMLEKEDIDLIFLDIQMPQITGLEWLRSLPRPPLTIFTTAFAEYAVEGFELNAVDYLLKPIAFDRFLKAVQKAKEHYRHQQGTTPEMSAGDEEYIFVKADKKLVKVNFADVLYIEGLKDYVQIWTDQGRVVTLQTMKSLENKLPGHFFQRIHRSYIVNVKRIQAVEGAMIEIPVKGQTKLLPIGKNYRDDVSRIIEQNRL